MLSPVGVVVVSVPSVLPKYTTAPSVNADVSISLTSPSVVKYPLALFATSSVAIARTQLANSSVLFVSTT